MSVSAIVVLSFLTASISVLAVCVFIHERIARVERDINFSLTQIARVVDETDYRIKDFDLHLTSPREYVLTPRDIEND